MTLPTVSLVFYLVAESRPFNRGKKYLKFTNIGQQFNHRQTPNLNRKSEFCTEKRKLNKRIKRLLGKYSSATDLKLATPVLGKKISDFVLKAQNCKRSSEDYKKFQDIKRQISEAKIKFPNIQLQHESLFFEVSKIIDRKKD